MSLREEFEKREESFISPFGCLSSDSKGRAVNEEPCEIRTSFQQDKERIVFSTAFRRLKYKTQVFLAPLGDQYRTRLTHTLEVAQIAKTIARAMHLNEDLAEAIALGHDLGHTPFGHGGETALKKIFPGNFSHNEQSLRIVDFLENKGKGINLTYEVRDGILKHSKGHGKIIPDDPEEQPRTAEGKVVRISDIMAYLNHDLEDAIRSGVIKAEQVPLQCSKILGKSHSRRATVMMKDLVYSSAVRNGELILSMSDEVFSAMTALRKFLLENVYRAPQVHEEFVKAKKILTELYSCMLNDETVLRKELTSMEMEGCMKNGQPRDRVVCDFVASMTDRHALDLYSSIFFPSSLV